MPRRCELTGAKTSIGRNVSHSNRHSPRTFLPNLQKTTLRSDALRRDVSLRITTRAIRSVQKQGGIDRFLLAADDASLSPDALRLKRQIRKALGHSAPSA
jgi:large subunit ribosomal protein L28